MVFDMNLDSLFKGWTGELKTKFINWLFLGEDYRVFNNVIIQMDDGSTQIDHVVVSKFGLFVIETKDKTGWIFGKAHEAQWTQVIYKRKYPFQNPLRQNYCHTKSLSEALGVAHEKIHSLVIFWGDCEFKSPMPENVFKGGIFNSKFKDYIESKNLVLLTPYEVNSICSYLTKAKEDAGFFGGLRHSREIKEKYASTTTCPKCGGNLIERISSKAQSAGEPFLGCSNYPRCLYTKHL